MAARLGLVFYTCGHQDPVPSGDRHVNGPCRMCMRRSRVCDYGHDHPWSDWSFDDCQRAADVSRKVTRP